MDRSSPPRLSCTHVGGRKRATGVQRVGEKLKFTRWLEAATVPRAGGVGAHHDGHGPPSCFVANEGRGYLTVSGPLPGSRLKSLDGGARCPSCTKTPPARGGLFGLPSLCHDQRVSPLTAELMESLRAAGAIGMTWWVSSTVLCAAILGGVWSQREDLRRLRSATLRWLNGLVILFFTSIVLFGVTMIWFSATLGAELVVACRAPELTCGTAASAWGWASTLGFLIGTTSFVGYLFAWVLAWRTITTLAPSRTRRRLPRRDRPTAPHVAPAASGPSRGPRGHSYGEEPGSVSR